MNNFFFILAIIIYFITEMVMLLFIFQLPPLMKTVKVKNEGITLHFFENRLQLSPFSVVSIADFQHFVAEN